MYTVEPIIDDGKIINSFFSKPELKIFQKFHLASNPY